MNNEIKLELDVNSGDGTHVKLIKYLVRFDSSNLTGDVVFTTASRTMGWKINELWPGSIFTDCKVRVVKALLIKTCNTKTKEDNKVVDVLWTRDDFASDLKVNLHNMARQHASAQVGGEEVITYVLQVVKFVCLPLSLT